ncbi:OLC1v1002030C1 [Oldenlandia corymbosa var. corymbosa]|uniref:OLC1v1002030C1 n=1 Tax=Oldenlandia corymbosa var. corymbosa TaxID=529605 RepID=A0AAV1D8Z6_OLDCO|nr:OLC1v1002030C1 [Oldenlandia corymbosa var. corymbosa]
MGNVVGSVLTGFSEVLGKLLGHPLDFLSGKSCSTNCGPTWDLICYIDNFCISQLLKLALVVVLLYFVLLFFYLSYKLGICQCICHTICRSIWACCAIYFSTLECCCTFLCSKLDKHNQRRRRRRRASRDIEAIVAVNSEEYDDYDDDDAEERISVSSSSRRISRNPKVQSRRGRNYRKEHVRRALRPKSHHVDVRIRERSFGLEKGRCFKNCNYNDQVNPADGIRVSRRSKFAQRRNSFKGSIHHRRYR